MDVLIKQLGPSNSDAWNSLCLKSSNLIQSTFYDEVQTFFNKKPCYYEVWEGNVLAGGIKVFEYESGKLPGLVRSISRNTNIFSEIVFDKEEEIGAIGSLVSQKLSERLINSGTVSYTLSGHYGNSNLMPIIDIGKIKKQARFNIAYIDLVPTDEAMWKRVKATHRTEIYRGIKNNVTVLEEPDIEKFIELLNLTYSYQGISGPNNNFLRHTYKILSKYNCVKIYFAKLGEEYLSSAFIMQYGKSAEYAFGGRMRNNVGAGHFLHWELAKKYKAEGYEKYIMGQVSDESAESTGNIKFEQGISKFKRHFGTMELNSFSKEAIINNFQYSIWKTLQKIVVRN